MAMLAILAACHKYFACGNKVLFCSVPSRYLFLNLNDYFGMCVSIRWFKQRSYWRVSIISTLTVCLSLKRRSFSMLISHWLTSTTFLENNYSQETPSWAPACNGKRGNLPSRGKWKCWRVHKSLILITKWWLDGDAKCIIPMGEWCLMLEQCFSMLFSKYVFGFWGFAPDLRRSSILGPPIVRRPLSLLPLNGNILRAPRPIVNILSSSYRFILIGRLSRKKIVRKILDLCVEIDYILHFTQYLGH